MRLKRLNLLFLLIMATILMADEIKIPEQTSQHHLKDKDGEIILRVKRAKWIFNCTDCHADFKVKTMAREMVADHQDLNYDHIKGDNWCFSCHYQQLDKRNRIKLTSGKYRGPEDLIKLCSQCHGEKTREWQIGIHGKTTGTWKTYGDQEGKKMTCHQCHSPHHPRSFQVIPEPGPRLRFEYKVKDHAKK